MALKLSMWAGIEAAVGPVTEREISEHEWCPGCNTPYSWCLMYVEFRVPDSSGSTGSSTKVVSRCYKCCVKSVKGAPDLLMRFGKEFESIWRVEKTKVFEIKAEACLKMMTYDYLARTLPESTFDKLVYMGLDGGIKRLTNLMEDPWYGSLWDWVDRTTDEVLKGLRPVPKEPKGPKGLKVAKVAKVTKVTKVAKVAKATRKRPRSRSGSVTVTSLLRRARLTSPTRPRASSI